MFAGWPELIITDGYQPVNSDTPLRASAAALRPFPAPARHPLALCASAGVRAASAEARRRRRVYVRRSDGRPKIGGAPVTIGAAAGWVRGGSRRCATARGPGLEEMGGEGLKSESRLVAGSLYQYRVTFAFLRIQCRYMYVDMSGYQYIW